MEALVGRLVAEAIGEPGGQLAEAMFRLSPVSIKKLRGDTMLSLAQTHKVLAWLQQHQLVKQRSAEYCLQPEAIQARLRFSLYVAMAQRECNAGEGMQAALDLGSFSLKTLAVNCGDERQVAALAGAGFITPIEESILALKRNASASPGLRKKPKLMKSISESAKSSEEMHIVNWKMMDQRLIHMKLVEMVAKEDGERTALLISVMLPLPNPLTLAELTTLLPAALGFSLEEVEAILISLSAYLQPNGPRFSLSPTALLERLQLLTICKLVTAHLGESAGRIVLLLQHRSRLSEASIGDLGLLRGREACKVLESLETAGVVQHISTHWELNPALREQLAKSLAGLQQEQEQWLVLATQSCH